LRWPDSILWLISVLIVIVSPAAAVFGTLTRGFTPDAMILIPYYALAAAAADCNFYRARCFRKGAVSHLGNRHHVLRASKADAR
jgi:hypothetical protein